MAQLQLRASPLSTQRCFSRPCRAGIKPTRRVLRAVAQRSEYDVGRRELLGTSAGLAALSLVSNGGALAAPISVYDFAVKQYDQDVSLDQFRDQSVNYPGLRTLYTKYRDQGFNIIAFPCNQFGGQAPGTSEEERQFAFKKFGFEFPIMDKLEVNGPDAHPLYRFLKDCQPSSLPNSTKMPSMPGERGRLEWNYVKFLVARDGLPVKRFKPAFDPLDFESDVRLLLAGKSPLPAECIAHPGRSVCKVERLLEA